MWNCPFIILKTINKNAVNHLCKVPPVRKAYVRKGVFCDSYQPKIILRLWKIYRWYFVVWRGYLLVTNIDFSLEFFDRCKKIPWFLFDIIYYSSQHLLMLAAQQTITSWEYFGIMGRKKFTSPLRGKGVEPLPHSILKITIADIILI